MTGSASDHIRVRIVIRGAVQGVGFRPFVYRLARELALNGWVSNTSQGVFIEAEGIPGAVREFVSRVRTEIPPRASIQSFEHSFLDASGFRTFEIRESTDEGTKSVLILPDIATCPDCLREIFDPANRRYRYPFTNCTNCGPRFSIIESLPYDRPRTSMKRFAMCPECEREYHNPEDRRFHAQPNACPVCGPRLESGKVGSGEGRKAGAGETVIGTSGEAALVEAVEAIRRGEIVAVKGLGGFHLIVDARNEEAVRRLRERKRREEKPFAVMVPSLAAARELCEISESEERLLTSPESPIVILKVRAQPLISSQHSAIASCVSPANPTLGLMLPYTPMHHLLMHELGFPVVATSGNLSDEPICIDEAEAFERLGEIADLFLIHDRPIVRHVDDSVVRIVAGRELVLRRARGYAPLPIPVPHHDVAILAVGAHLKNSVALVTCGNAFISQHIGDLETAESLKAFQRVVDDLQRLYEAPASIVVCDRHPDYMSTKEARERNPSPLAIQHHHAHILSCMAENDLHGEVLGVAWDGTGYGEDGTIWGGEFLRVDAQGAERIVHLRTFQLPGGDAAVKEPRRSALGVLNQLSEFRSQNLAGTPPGEDLSRAFRRMGFEPSELKLLLQMMEKGVNSPWTSSAGRLFDAVASLTGLRQKVRHEGQAAMELEYQASECSRERLSTAHPYEFAFDEGRSPMILDWEAMVRQILHDADDGIPISEIALKFHFALVEAIVAVARRVRLERIVLSGGCFQNVLLTERAIFRLREEGFRPYWHQRVPPNDGGIALGQAYGAILIQRRDGA